MAHHQRSSEEEPRADHSTPLAARPSGSKLTIGLCQVYDLTGFQHPGGQKILLKYAGRDATEEYNEVHPPRTIEDNLPKDKHLGPVDMSTVETTRQGSTAETAGRRGQDEPSLANCLNLDDIEKAAE